METPIKVPHSSRETPAPESVPKAHSYSDLTVLLIFLPIVLGIGLLGTWLIIRFAR